MTSNRRDDFGDGWRAALAALQAAARAADPPSIAAVLLDPRCGSPEWRRGYAEAVAGAALARTIQHNLRRQHPAAIEGGRRFRG